MIKLKQKSFLSKKYFINYFEKKIEFSNNLYSLICLKEFSEINDSKVRKRNKIYEYKNAVIFFNLFYSFFLFLFLA